MITFTQGNLLEARVEALARYRAGETDITVERRNTLNEEQPS